MNCTDTFSISPTEIKRHKYAVGVYTATQLQRGSVIDQLHYSAGHSRLDLFGCRSSSVGQPSHWRTAAGTSRDGQI